jgi:DNA-binding NarL/FixJ family response regulator
MGRVPETGDDGTAAGGVDRSPATIKAHAAAAFAALGAANRTDAVVKARTLRLI